LMACLIGSYMSCHCRPGYTVSTFTLILNRVYHFDIHKHYEVHSMKSITLATPIERYKT